MADVYVDLDGGGSGTSPYDTWAKATDDLALATGVAVSGDYIWVQGATPKDYGNVTKNFGPGYQNQYVYIIGVKDGTTNEPPAGSDVVPGLATGDSTRAYDQTAGNAAPTIQCIGASGLMIFSVKTYCYGIKFEVGNYFQASSQPQFHFEECSFKYGVTSGCSRGAFLLFGWTGDNANNKWVNNKWEWGGNSTGQWGPHIGGGRNIVIGSEMAGYGSRTSHLFLGISAGHGTYLFHGNDFSNMNSAGASLHYEAQIVNDVIYSQNKMPATLPITDTNPGQNVPASILAVATAPNGTAKGAGDSFQDTTIVTNMGDCDQETTIVRTGGATEGTGEWSWALQSLAGFASEQAPNVCTPWLSGKVEGDGTSKTVTVYIANSGAGDYQDDDVWFEILYPSEDGQPQGAYKTTKPGPGQTPATLTDDTTSDWSTGAGGKNAQKITVSIAPAYTGPFMVKVYFSKAFASSPEILYVDPKVEIT